MITKEEVQDKLQIFAACVGKYRSCAFSRGFAKGAIWARDQNAARIAELEAMLSKSAFNLDGHIILLQAANQQIEKERQRISELEEQKAELIEALRALFDEQSGAPVRFVSRERQYKEAYEKCALILQKYDPAK
jgi:uncharacterized protein (UPF0335 family)